jgi:hypothetical protein
VLGGTGRAGSLLVAQRLIERRLNARTASRPMIGEGITVPTRGGAQAFIDAADIASVAVETLVGGTQPYGR